MILTRREVERKPSKNLDDDVPVVSTLLTGSPINETSIVDRILSLLRRKTSTSAIAAHIMIAYARTLEELSIALTLTKKTENLLTGFLGNSASKEMLIFGNMFHR